MRYERDIAWWQDGALQSARTLPSDHLPAQLSWFLALDSGESPRKLLLKEEWKRRVHWNGKFHLPQNAVHSKLQLMKAYSMMMPCLHLQFNAR
jgi:hypothetical protein